LQNPGAAFRYVLGVGHAENSGGRLVKRSRRLHSKPRAKQIPRIAADRSRRFT
jgi:hypothetical protein